MHERDGARVPYHLEIGIRAIGGLAGCEIRSPAVFDERERRWIVTAQLIRAEGVDFIPRRTEWKVLVDPDYPAGRISFYPSATGGITATFPHQERNTRGSEGRLWRDGKLCLDTPLRDTAYSRDPVGDADRRLRWYFERALAWLDAAASGALVGAGEPFEIPQRPARPADAKAKIRIVHDESSDTFRLWLGRSGIGSAKLRPIGGLGSAVAVAEFLDASGRSVRTWGGRPCAGGSEGTVDALWWIWPAPIVIKPWQAPSTWGELRRAGKAIGIDVDANLREVAKRRRGRSEGPAVLLLGYAIPRRIGDEASEMHWDSLLLPEFEKGTAPCGFRPNEKGWWARDRRKGILANSASLVHLETENWAASRLLARGGLAESARGMKVAVIGVGALGSAIAELLARVGAARFLLVDDDMLTAGNVCRHVATLVDVGKRKVDVVASRLEQISPHLIVDKMPGNLPIAVAELERLLDPYDVVIDCTASNEALSGLARGWWAVPRLFVSASVGHSAQRLFAFTSFGNQFPAAAFHEQLRPWLRNEAAMWISSGEVLEGAGCWSPVSPARYDDLMLSAATCVKILELAIAAREPGSSFRVFERDPKDGSFRASTSGPSHDEGDGRGHAS